MPGFKQWGGDYSIDKTLLEKYLKYLSIQIYSQFYFTHSLASLVRSEPHPEERKGILKTALCLIAKTQRGSSASVIVVSRYTPISEIHRFMKDCHPDDDLPMQSSAPTGIAFILSRFKDWSVFRGLVYSHLVFLILWADCKVAEPH